ncbi:hypothetical protein CSKR_101854 [Clonorchis sinensis]|uniref:Uncharacterized protein n=1 Tax=Clonorchis sinensis TaxID=79923 RepID=A0A419QBM0_CLOSI|nr:hypothetical protein CSKR_101854 [Clonorchis sinensis]
MLTLPNEPRSGDYQRVSKQREKSPVGCSIQQPRCHIERQQCLHRQRGAAKTRKRARGQSLHLKCLRPVYLFLTDSIQQRRGNPAYEQELPNVLFASAGILPGHPHLDMMTIRVLNQSFWLKSLTAKQWCLAGNASTLPLLPNNSPHMLQLPTWRVGEGDCVCQTSSHRQTWYKRLCDCRADTPEYSLIDPRGTQTGTPRILSVPNCHATRRTRAGILPGCREAEVGFEPRTFRSVNSRSNHLGRLAPIHL